MFSKTQCILFEMLHLNNILLNGDTRLGQESNSPANQ